MHNEAMALRASHVEVTDDSGIHVTSGLAFVPFALKTP